MSVELQALAQLVEQRTVEIAAQLPSDWRDPNYVTALTAMHFAARECIDGLVAQHGARFHRRAGGTYHLKLQGIACSCTSGELALLRAWARKARLAMSS